MFSKETLSVKELAEYLGIGLNSAYGLVKTVDFPAIKIGEKRIVIPIELLKNWLKSKSNQ